MRIFRTPSVGRSALLQAGLLLFLLGSNYCLVGALIGGGSAMACMAPKTAHQLPSNLAPEQKAEAAHAAAPSCHGGDGEAPSPAMPCCIALAPVVAPKADTVDPATQLIAAVFLPEPEVAIASPEVKGPALRAPPGEAPPAFLSRAPHSSRAPPLA